jgi:hypothetical protein
MLRQRPNASAFRSCNEEAVEDKDKRHIGLWILEKGAEICGSAECSADCGKEPSEWLTSRFPMRRE